MNRVGLGFDAHAFEDGRPLVLGGVTIPDHDGLSGHSDADVLSHAIADALLGAAGLGDLGLLFPNDERWKGVSSLAILQESFRAAAGAGWAIVNVDASLIAQTPKLAPYRSDMERNIALALSIEADFVSVKATTTDGLGFTGRSEGVAALAVVLIERA